MKSEASPTVSVLPLPSATISSSFRSPKRAAPLNRRTRAMLILTVALGIVPGGLAVLSVLWFVGTAEARSVLKWALVVAVGMAVWL